VEELRLELFGQPVVCRDGESRSAVAASLQPMLAFLALEPESVCSRDRLIDCLWPDAHHGRQRLNTAVWRCRQLFGDADVIEVHRSGYVALDTDVVAVDVVPVARALTDGNRARVAAGDEDARRRLCGAVTTNWSRFLAGNYDDWVVRTRDRLQRAVVKGVDTLSQSASEPEEAIEWTERLVALDPLREDGHRHLIRLYATAGRRSDALRQYDDCVRNLRDELGVEPLVETTLVAAAVRGRVEPLPMNGPDHRLALDDLRVALASCRVAIDQIETALASLPCD
jgi:DNA-binding SARP family transcriptional activator